MANIAFGGGGRGPLATGDNGLFSNILNSIKGFGSSLANGLGDVGQFLGSDAGKGLLDLGKLGGGLYFANAANQNQQHQLGIADAQLKLLQDNNQFAANTATDLARQFNPSLAHPTSTLAPNTFVNQGAPVVRNNYTTNPNAQSLAHPNVNTALV